MLLLWSIAWTALGQEPAPTTRYISDETAVTLRQDKGMAAEVVALIKSGARVELIESDEASGYSRVRVGPGREGWVLTRYLTDQPAAREKLAAVSASLADQQARVRQLELEVQRLRTAANASTVGVGAAPRPAAATPAPTADDDGYTWSEFFTGAALFLVGLLMGLIASQVLAQGRRRRRWTPDL